MEAKQPNSTLLNSTPLGASGTKKVLGETEHREQGLGVVERETIPSGSVCPLSWPMATSHFKSLLFLHVCDSDR